MTISRPIQTAAPAGRTGPRMALCLALLMAVVWCVGFLRFADSIAREEPARETTVDAIVVLTGGAQRLGAGFRLLREGWGTKLFLSGVNEDVRLVDLHALTVLHQTAEPADFPRCCVELGFQAKDTRGNATEIARWVRTEDVRSVILVTSNYHMQRALLELRATLPAARIHPHPVIARTVMLHSWWRWPGSLVLLIGEYHKLLLAGFRVLLRGSP
jgi:uncharacterized SAM-binding protein YcdF (DUF218 family)